MPACVLTCVRVRARACLRACVRACVLACVRACMLAPVVPQSFGCAALASATPLLFKRPKPPVLRDFSKLVWQAQPASSQRPQACAGRGCQQCCHAVAQLLAICSATCEHRIGGSVFDGKGGPGLGITKGTALLACLRACCESAALCRALPRFAVLLLCFCCASAMFLLRACCAP